MRTRPRDFEPRRPEPGSIPFPRDAEHADRSPRRRPGFDLTGLPESAGLVYEAIDSMSRRIDDLARELNCLGYFDDEDPGPRAA